MTREEDTNTEVKEAKIVTPKSAPTTISEAVGETDNVVEAVEFSPKPAPPIETPDNPGGKKPKASQNKAKDVETKPIARVDVENELKAQQRDIDELAKSGQRLQQQLNRTQQQLTQLNETIIAKTGAVAVLEKTLGIKQGDAR
jgi:hypothetical protein